MIEFIKPVKYGILIGLLGLMLGLGWAFYLVLGHASIHKSLDERMIEGLDTQDSLLNLIEPENAYAHSDAAKDVQKHGDTEEKVTMSSGHDNPVIDLAHKRLTRGHIHAMGLGLVTIAVSLILAFTGAPRTIKGIAAVLTGLGGILYPLGWIVMGYRTPSLGPDAAEASAVIIAGPGSALVLLGIFTAVIFLLKDIFSEK